MDTTNIIQHLVRIINLNEKVSLVIEPLSRTTVNKSKLDYPNKDKILSLGVDGYTTSIVQKISNRSLNKFKRLINVNCYLSIVTF